MLFVFAEGLTSYIIPKGVQRGNEVELSDRTYDGEDEGDRLVNGLGQLVDGQKGVDNFRSDVHGFGKGRPAFHRRLKDDARSTTVLLPVSRESKEFHPAPAEIID